MENLETIIASLKSGFQRQDIKEAVLRDEWLEKNINSQIHSTGFCYSASEVIYRLTGCKENWFKKSISKEKWKYGGHCFLQNKKTNEILDITSDQYSELNIPIPYELGVAGGFRTITNSAKILSKLCGLGDLKACHQH
jgi:hypothetical protein